MLLIYVLNCPFLSSSSVFFECKFNTQIVNKFLNFYLKNVVTCVQFMNDKHNLANVCTVSYLSLLLDSSLFDYFDISCRILALWALVA